MQLFSMLSLLIASFQCYHFVIMNHCAMVNAYATGQLKRLPPSRVEQYNTVRNDLKEVCQVVKDLRTEMLQAIGSNNDTNVDFCKTKI